MGSFSVACQISGITIGCGEDVVLLPLVEAEFKDFGITRWNLYCTPIFGKYDGYGCIEDIEENVSTKIITNVHGSVDNFLEKLDRGCDEDFVDGIKYCFVDREIYDFCTKHSTKVDIENVDYEGIDFIWGIENYGISSTYRHYIVNYNFNEHPLYKQFVDEQIQKNFTSIQKEFINYVRDKEFLQLVFDTRFMLYQVRTFSKVLSPVDILSSPQFPEHKIHQKYLEEFLKIVKQRVKDL